MNNNNKIIYLYAANGTKLKKEVWNSGSLTCEKYYAGSFVYNNEGIEYILFDEGRLIPQADRTYQYEYFLCDHLGNTRVVFTGQEEGLAVLQESHYYPFGMEFMGVGGEQMDVTNYYKYNGKELQDDGFDLDGNGVYESRLLWYDYGARFYDAQIGRWHAVDPVTQFASPYIGMGNNPVSLIDPNGMAAGGWPRRFWNWLFGGGNECNDCQNESSNVYKNRTSWSFSWSAGGSGNSSQSNFNWYSGGLEIGSGNPSNGYSGIRKGSGGNGGGQGSGLGGGFYNHRGKIPPTPSAADRRNLEGTLNNLVDASSSGGTNFSLGLMYGHFQLGGTELLSINTSSIDFSGSSQNELGLTGMKVDETWGVDLFKSGINPISLAFGRVNMTYHGDNQFSISDRFDFTPLWDPNVSIGRNTGNMAGFLINYNVPLMQITPLAPLVPLIFGGPYDIHFIGTTYIKP